jgi:phosphate transport system substrate-binding protein
VRLQRIPRRTGQLVAVLAAGSFALTACGSDGPGDTAAPSSGTSSSTSAAAAVSGTISGVGSTAQQAAMQAWVAGFQASNPGATINYDPQGSGAGRTQFLAGGSVAFAGSDAALKDTEVAAATTRCGGPVVEVPLYISPIAVVYNLKGHDDLQLSPATLAKIFSQKITTWDDAAIKADNPDVSDLPSTKITPVNRQDSSGTTQNFTDYLGKTDPTDWAFPNSGDFPVKGGEAAQGTSGLIDAVGAADGGIGYADDSQAGDLQIAKIKVGDTWVKPSADAAAKTVGESPQVDGRTATDLALSLKRDGTDGYPIVLTTYSILCSSYTDAATGNLVKAFFGYVASDDGQKAGADAAKSAPLSGDLQTKVQGVLSGITAG